MALPTASDNPFPSFLVTEGSAPSSPAAGKQRLYIDSADHKLKRKNSSGTVTTIEAAAGAVSSDTIWDAKGDLAVGTGADTAAKLTVGTNSYALHADSSQSTGLKWANIIPPCIYPIYGFARAAELSVGAANRAIFVPCYVPCKVTITGLRLKIGNATGNGDVGFYSSAGSRLASNGGGAWPGTGIQTINFSASYDAEAGWYYMAVAASSNTATFSVVNVGDLGGPLNARFQDTMYPLGTTFTSGGETSRDIAVIGIISGGIS